MEENTFPPAGAELDALVASRVMGLPGVQRIPEVPDKYVWLRSTEWIIPVENFISVNDSYDPVPDYSTNPIQSYWVLQKCIRHESDVIKERFIVELARIIAGRDERSSSWSWRDIRLMLGARPEDICYAALLAVGGKPFHVDHS